MNLSSRCEYVAIIFLSFRHLSFAIFEKVIDITFIITANFVQHSNYFVGTCFSINLCIFFLIAVLHYSNISRKKRCSYLDASTQNQFTEQKKQQCWNSVKNQKLRNCARSKFTSINTRQLYRKVCKKQIQHIVY